MQGYLATGVLAACFAGAAIGRIRRWRLGRAAAPVGLVSGVRNFARRYLRDVHAVVSRDRYAAVMHACAAGGALLCGLLAPAVAATNNRTVALALLTSAGAALCGATLAALRPLLGRRYSKPRKFRRIAIAVCVLAIASALLAWSVLRGSAERGVDSFYDQTILAGFAYAAIELLVAAWHGPMRHALAGAIFLALHPRPGRFEGHADAALRDEDLGGVRYGVARIADFGWTTIASFDACVECSRCTMVCPAHASGMPLDPKGLIQSLASSSVTDALVREPGILPATLWACTTCRACVDACPMMIEHVDAVVSLRRFQVMEEGAAPAKAAALLDEMRQTDLATLRASRDRLDWATDLRLPTMKDAGRARVLLWFGESANSRRGQRTCRALVELLRTAEVDFAVLGDEELDCGHEARRIGDEAVFAQLREQNLVALAKYRFDVIVTPDAHALHTLRAEYGAPLNVVHHSEFLADLLRHGHLQVSAGARRPVTYHDPCYLGRYAGQFTAPRAVLEGVGIQVVEMPRSRQSSFCCGGGGGVQYATNAGGSRIAEQRVAEAEETGATAIAVGCPRCADMLEGVAGRKLPVADVAEILAACVPVKHGQAS